MAKAETSPRRLRNAGPGRVGIRELEPDDIHLEFVLGAEDPS